MIANQDFEDASASPPVDPDEQDAIRKSRIRDSNKEFARRMTILQAWSQYWSENQTREGDAYPLQVAKNIMKKSKKITCPIQSCRKAFTTIGGLRYHYARCNIERTIKCLLCNPNPQLATRGELLRHMILRHSSELPSLNPEQQEIVSSYFSCEHRIDKREKREKRVNIESESHCNSQAIVKSYYDLIVRNYHPSWATQRPFMSWFSQTKDYELITHIGERQKHYPPELESVNVKLPQNGEWTNLKTGEYTNIEFDKRNNPTSYLFYTGGINTAIAWKPKSIYDRESQNSGELLAIAVNSCSMEQSYTFKESHHNEGCLQFWTLENAALTNGSNVNNTQQVSPTKISLTYMIAHKYGTIFDMAWCPLGTSWMSKEMHTDAPYTREGLLALACGDGQIRILCIPDSKFLLNKAQARSSDNIIDSTPMFRVKPIANLMPPGTGPSSDYQAMSCKSIAWSAENGQRLIAAGYVNGSVALFDLSTSSSILYVQLDHYRHVYQPQKSWFAHGGPVTSIAFSAFNGDRYLIATGSFDRQVKICNPFDLSATLVSERAPVNKVCWDFRFRGVVAATDHAFTSFNNKVSYKYPYSEGYQSVTIASHRASVYGLANSILTSSVATSDQAGEVFVTPQLINKTYHRRDKNLLSVHSLFTMVPSSLRRQQVIVKSEVNNITINQQATSEQNDQSLVCVDNGTYTVLTSAPSNSASTRVYDPTVASPLIQVQPALLQSNQEQQQHHSAIGQYKAQTPIIHTTEDTQQLITSSQGDEADEDGLDAEADFTHIERTVANMPDKFLLPIEHKPVSTYENFKCNFGLEFHTYDSIPTRQDAKIPESCIRAMDMKRIYCDRPCDYPFSSINQVAWSPNTTTYPYLLCATQIGFCRLNKVLIVEQIFKSHVEQLKPKIGDL